jgi:hypothetical protein
MYQAKVQIIIFRRMKINLTLKKPKRKFRKLEENIMSKKRESRSQKKTKRFYSKFEHINIHSYPS